MEWVVLRFLLLFKAGDHNAFSFHWKFSLKWNCDKNHYLSTETFPILERRGRNSAHHYSGCLRRFSKNQLWEVIWTITTLFPCNQWNFFSPIRRTFYLWHPSLVKKNDDNILHFILQVLQLFRVQCYCINGKVHKTWNVADS